jgi:toxin ParE1/3/4
MHYALTPRARADLDEIWDHSVREWGDARAEKYLLAFRSAFETLTEHPRLGRSAHVIRPGYRSFAVNSHVVFYRISKDQIDIVRILHQKSDHTARLSERTKQ